MNQVKIAQAIAIEAHQGQLYGDRDYIEAHVAPIAEDIQRMGYGADFQATGWLHDVLEDSKDNGHEVTSKDLLSRGILPHIVQATELLTHAPEQPHGLYLALISHNKHATVAKLADSLRNLANSVMYPDEDPAKREQRVTKYLGNVAFLRQFLPEPDNKPRLRIVK